MTRPAGTIPLHQDATGNISAQLPGGRSVPATLAGGKKVENSKKNEIDYSSESPLQRLSDHDAHAYHPSRVAAAQDQTDSSAAENAWPPRSHLAQSGGGSTTPAPAVTPHLAITPAATPAPILVRAPAQPGGIAHSDDAGHHHVVTSSRNARRGFQHEGHESTSVLETGKSAELGQIVQKLDAIIALLQLSARAAAKPAEAFARTRKETALSNHSVGAQ
jgi:hypothetical protein